MATRYIHIQTDTKYRKNWIIKNHGDTVFTQGIIVGSMRHGWPSFSLDQPIEHGTPATHIYWKACALGF